MKGLKIGSLAALALVVSAQAGAATTANFDFYLSGGPLIDTVSSAPTYNDGLIGVTIRAYDGSGKLVSVADRFDGIGVLSGGLDAGEINRSLFGGTGERLELTFNQAVQLNAIGLSQWENTPLIGDAASLSTGSTSIALGSSNDNGLLVKTFNLSSPPTGTVFNLQATGAGTAFRLAGLSVTAVPEVNSLSLMGLGLAGMGLVLRRRRS
ncbi:MAG: PEP-CTERM sorting domain-containing protein [Burkholderiales bacterium]|nr:PEP-CTERM sorting domain-containing protein [Burkholderiales bacterium]MDE2078093.1 PEP-CTERM sorting domain-containing protein [Burkholderiales bacterium]MDE2434415.1 PEP-CTERM sorting domain-containing protein [Burkholderiales bacterium]